MELDYIPDKLSEINSEIEEGRAELEALEGDADLALQNYEYALRNSGNKERAEQDYRMLRDQYGEQQEKLRRLREELNQRRREQATQIEKVLDKVFGSQENIQREPEIKYEEENQSDNKSRESNETQSVSRKNLEGKVTKVKADNGKEYEVRYKVLESEKIKVSNKLESHGVFNKDLMESRNLNECANRKK